MDESDWDIQEIKRLKKKQLVQYNFVMFLLVALFAYFVKSGGSATVFLGLCCAYFWIFTGSTIYTLITGKVIGTKSGRRVQAFDRDRIGEKRWKRKTTIAPIVLLVLSIGFTVFWYVTDFDASRLEFSIGAIPFFACWIGYNIGESVRISKL